MLLYDELGGHKGLRRHRHLTKRQALRLAPALKPDALDRRAPVLGRPGRRRPPHARHRAHRRRLRRRRGQPRARRRLPARGRARDRRARARPRSRGEEIEVRARQVINATGVWTDDVQHLVGERGKFQVRASKGIHLVVPRDRLQLDTGLILRTEKSVLFVIPWGRHWIIGTTDTDWKLDKAHPGRQPQRHRLRARAGQRRARPAAQPRGRRGRLRRAAAAARRRVGEHEHSSAASTPSPCPCPGWWPSRAASTRPTG